MKTEKRNLRDLVAASNEHLIDSDSIYANIRYTFSPKKLEAYLKGLSAEEKAQFDAYGESTEGKREQKEHQAKEKQLARLRASNRRKRIFHERLTKIQVKTSQSPRLAQAQTLTMDELAESLILFPELLPAGHKAPALTLARKHFKSILQECEKEYLRYTWVDTTIPVELCYSEVKQPYSFDAPTSLINN